MSLRQTTGVFCTHYSYIIMLTLEWLLWLVEAALHFESWLHPYGGNPLEEYVFVLPPMPTLKFALPPTQNPNVSRWNIGGVGCPTRGAGVGHVDFMLFVSILLLLVTQCEPSFQWNMGFKLFISEPLSTCN